jgi:hypothetical protein
MVEVGRRQVSPYSVYVTMGENPYKSPESHDVARRQPEPMWRTPLIGIIATVATSTVGAILGRVLFPDVNRGPGDPGWYTGAATGGWVGLCVGLLLLWILTGRRITR